MVWCSVFGSASISFYYPGKLYMPGVMQLVRRKKGRGGGRGHLYAKPVVPKLEKAFASEYCCQTRALRFKSTSLCVPIRLEDEKSIESVGCSHLTGCSYR